jgi:hypothetical protein
MLSIDKGRKQHYLGGRKHAYVLYRATVLCFNAPSTPVVQSADPRWPRVGESGQWTIQVHIGIGSGEHSGCPIGSTTGRALDRSMSVAWT